MGGPRDALGPHHHAPVPLFSRMTGRPRDAPWLREGGGAGASGGHPSGFHFASQFAPVTLRDGSVPSAAPQVADFERLSYRDTHTASAGGM